MRKVTVKPEAVENEKKKEYLRGYCKHGKRISRIEAEIEEIRRMKANPSFHQTGMPKKKDKKDLSDYVAVLDSLEQEMYEEGVNQVMSYKEIAWNIKELAEEDERDVLFYRYIKGKNWWEIAVVMNCSESWVYELHGRALKKLKISPSIKS